MILAYPCYSIIIKRDAITKPWAFDEMVEKGGISECRYDDHIATFLGGMNTYDLEKTIEYLNEKLGIEILDMSDPEHPKEKDGRIRASGFTHGRVCGWYVYEGLGSHHLISYLPEEARTFPKEDLRQFEPTCVRDFGFFDRGRRLSIMRGYQGFFLHFDTDHLLPKRWQNDEAACRSMTEDEVVSIMKFYGIRLVNEPDNVLKDYGDYKGWRMRLVNNNLLKSRYVAYKDMVIPFPRESKDIGKNLNREDAISLVEKTIEAYEKGSKDYAFSLGRANNKRKPNGFTREIGEYEGSMIILKDGRYGIFLHYKDRNYSLPDDCRFDETKAMQLTLEQACLIIKPEASPTHSKRNAIKQE